PVVDGWRRPEDIAAFEALLRDRQAGMPTAEAAPAGPVEAIPEMALPVGMMRLTLERLVDRLETHPDLPRAARAGIWALRAEERKLAALDGYISGLIRG
ncbi:MAG: hypothetical protein AAF390_21550, partial [Pseudomonadota bacterium]